MKKRTPLYEAVRRDIPSSVPFASHLVIPIVLAIHRLVGSRRSNSMRNSLSATLMLMYIERVL